MRKLLLTAFALLISLPALKAQEPRPTTIFPEPDRPFPGRDTPGPGAPLGAIVLAEKERAKPMPSNYELLYTQDFSKKAALKDFAMTDPKAWRLTRRDGRPALDQYAQSGYTPPVRSPRNIAIIADKVFGDFILEADLLSTTREYGHRDLCLFFGMQDPAKFYYVHIASKADPNAHNIFVVNDAPRRNIARRTTEGIQWTEGWHKVRIERTARDGLIRVFFDNMNEPLMVAEDQTFTAGYIGFGSFDDTGLFKNIRIWGPSAEEKPAAFYRRP